MKRFLASLAVPALVCGAGEALAAQPQEWELGFQPAASPIMRQIEWFNAYTLWFIVPITLLVVVLLGICIVRFRASRNPVPSRTSHNTLIEVIWTVGPVIVLLFIAVPSFQLLTAQYTPPEEPQLTVKATGNQWYWSYDYEVEDPVSFTSMILADTDREEAGKSDLAVYPRLLTVDNELVVPVDTTIRVQITGSDVIHSFAMPAFGIKVDAVPGRLEETWFKALKEGLYYGQCSELCGKDHAFMPIAIRVVSKENFDTWLAAAREDLPSANQQLMATIKQDKNNAAADEESKVASAGE